MVPETRLSSTECGHVFIHCVVNIFPDDLVVTLHGSVAFICVARASTITGVQWLVNNMMTEDIDDINITTEVITDLGIGSLSLTNIPMVYNRTTITCIAQLASGQEEVTVLLLIQGLRNGLRIIILACQLPDICTVGLLSAVGSLNITASDSTLSLTWEPPFSLDITNVDPDITGYCVDAINSTSSVTLHSECGINTTMFTYPKPSDTDCVVYSFSVTPHNVVGAGEITTEVYSGDIESISTVKMGVLEFRVFYYFQVGNTSLKTSVLSIG